MTSEPCPAWLSTSVMCDACQRNGPGACVTRALEDQVRQRRLAQKMRQVESREYVQFTMEEQRELARLWREKHGTPHPHAVVAARRERRLA